MLTPHLILTRAELKSAVAHLSEQDAFSFDVETDGLDTRINWVTWIGLGSYGRTYLVPMGHTKGRLKVPGYTEKVLPPEDQRRVLQSGKLSQAKIARKVPPVYYPPPVQLDPALVFGELEPLFFGDQIKVAFNARFDLLTIAKYYGGMLPEPPYEDPMIMTHVLDENRRDYKLKEIILDWLNIRNPERRKTYYPKLGATIQDEPLDAVARYLAKDAYLLWLYWKFCRSRLDREKLMSVFKMEMDLYPTLMRMQHHGIGIDIDKLTQVQAHLEEEMEQWEERAWTIVGRPFPLTNVNEKRDLLFKPKDKEGHQGLKPLKRTPKTQQPVLDAHTLEHYARSNALADVFARWAEVQKLHSTYIVGLKATSHTDRTGTFIYTQLTQHRTVTGRFSSTEPNLQNIPRESEIRGMFIAPPGYLLVVADYDQIELRVFAHFLQDPVMMSIFHRGLDIHAETASFILHKPALALSKEERTTAGKTINFAVSYGAGLGRLMAAGISQQTAQQFLNLYFQRFATIKPWRRTVLLEAHRRGDRHDTRRHPPYVTTLLGRRRRLEDLYDFNDRDLQARAERQAWNHRIQGTAAEIMKIAMLRVDRAFLGTPFKMLLTVHDEIIALAPEDRAEECQAVMTTAMSGIMRSGKPILDVPLVVSCGIARAWNDAKG
jgi:DNA polymerase I-like protein with 3'-5' exonuclease and polymerase domains